MQCWLLTYLSSSSSSSSFFSSSPLLCPTFKQSIITTTTSSSSRRTSTSRRWLCLRAEEEEEKKKDSVFDIDAEKARAALRELDRQIESLSEQETKTRRRPSSSPPPGPKLERERITGAKMNEFPEISDSFLAYTAAGLVALTIINNIIFYALIKPSVDGYEDATKMERRVPLTEHFEHTETPKIAD